MWRGGGGGARNEKQYPSTINKKFFKKKNRIMLMNVICLQYKSINRQIILYYILRDLLFIYF